MSDIFQAYLAGAARDFYAQHFADAGDRGRAVARAARPLAPAVAAALERQNARLAPSPAREAHLAALRRGAAAVVTGQQVGLFLGPLFNLYKAASAITAARALARETGATVVPVFWLQSEDHDLPEIASCHLPCARGEPLSLHLPAAPEQRISIAHLRLPVEVADCLDRMRREIDGLPHAARHLERLARHYRGGAGWAEAFAGMLAELFSAEGLVLVDPRDQALAAATAPVHRRALEHAGAIADSLLTRGRALEAAGFAPVVHVRAGAPLSFFHPAGATGPRYRLQPAADGFAEVGGDGAHTRAALLAALDTEPLRFSSSVLLRPIVQDVLLPTAAYVGGPAEVAYFAQLAPVYDAFDLRPPLVVPRARLAVIEAKAARALARLHLEAAEAALPEDALVASAGSRLGERSDFAPALLASFDEALRPWRRRIEEAGAGMSTALDKTRATVEAAVSRLAAKYDRARLNADEELRREVRWLKSMLHPNGMPQERFYGVSYFAARYGEEAFLQSVLATVAPFDATPRQVFPEEE